MTDADGRDEGHVLAGEYVLGLLEGDDLRAFERRLASEPQLREAVRAWEEDLVHIADEVEPVAPPPGLKRRVEARLFARPAARRPRWLAGLLSGLALGLVLLAVALEFAPWPPDAGYVTEIAAEDRSLVVRAALLGEDGPLAVERLSGAAPPGRVLQLWFLAEGATAPISLGILPETEEARIEVSQETAALFPGGLLEISEEPPGGSPTGLPTGEVLAIGQVPARG